MAKLMRFSKKIIDEVWVMQVIESGRNKKRLRVLKPDEFLR